MISKASSAEILIDFGEYRYSLNDAVTAVQERWTRHQLGDTVLTRVARNAPDYDQRLEVQAWQRAGAFERVLVSWWGESNVGVADYWLLNGRWQLRRQINGVQFSDELDGGLLFYPFMRVFTGATIRGVMAAGGQADILLPSIEDPQSPRSMLAANIIRRSSECVDLASQCYSFHGDRYDATARFWLGEQSLLLRYEWRQSEDQYWLVELQRPTLAQLNVHWL